MDISIIIATLNEEKYLRDTLESIHDQKTDKEFEVVLGDGKSTDGTLDIAREYGCSIANVEPGNIAIGRQAAAMISKGRMIVSADADSDYPSNWLEELTRPLMQKDVVATCGKILPAEGTRMEEVFADKILNNIASLTYLVKIPFAAASNMAMDRKAFERVGGYNVELLTAEDTDLMKRMMKAGKVAYCPSAVCYVSMRRVRQWGYAKYLSFHTKNFIKSHIGSKVFSTYEPIR